MTQMLLRPNKNETKGDFVMRFIKDENMKQYGVDVIEIAEEQWRKYEVMKKDIDKHNSNDIIIK